jgi:hypothetical protein
VSYGLIGDEPQNEDLSFEAARKQLTSLKAACEICNRPHGSVSKHFLSGFSSARLFSSVDAFVDYCGRYSELGFTDVIVHYPQEHSRFAMEEHTFARVIARAMDQVQAI